MHGAEDACIWTYAIRIAACTLYEVAVVKGFHRVKIYNITFFVDGSKAFVTGYVIVAHVETIHIEHI